MPRQARLDAPGVLHHVMGRGIEGEEIFINNKDRNDFINRLTLRFAPIAARGKWFTARSCVPEVGGIPHDKAPFP